MKTVFSCILVPGLMLLFSGVSEASDNCRGDDRIILASEDEFFPYTGLYEGELRGFSLDLVRAAYNAAGCDVELLAMPYNRCLREVESGRISGCFNTTNSSENQKKYIFHDVPLFRGKICIYGHPDGPREFTDSLFSTSTFSVVRGYTYTDQFDQNTAIRKIEVESDFQTLALVSRGRADYAAVYDRVAQFQTSRHPDRISPAPVKVRNLVEFDLFVSFSKVDEQESIRLAGLLDKGLLSIRASGLYDEIENLWTNWLDQGVRNNEPAPNWHNGIGN